MAELTKMTSAIKKLVKPRPAPLHRVAPWAPGQVGTFDFTAARGLNLFNSIGILADEKNQ
jgi:hypothetical protein